MRIFENSAGTWGATSEWSRRELTLLRALFLLPIAAVLEAFWLTRGTCQCSGVFLLSVIVLAYAPEAAVFLYVFRRRGWEYLLLYRRGFWLLAAAIAAARVVPPILHLQIRLTLEGAAWLALASLSGSAGAVEFCILFPRLDFMNRPGLRLRTQERESTQEEHSSP